MLVSIKNFLIRNYSDSTKALIASCPSANPTALDETLKLYHDSNQRIHARYDKIFAGLMIFQWLFGIFCALVISPKTWIGASQQTHLHVLSAFFLGGAIVSLPIYLGFLHPGKLFTRHTIAFSQALISALLIHLTGGRIETHFHVFGSLAFLAFYRDWRVLLTATTVVATDHFLRGVFYPQSVFGMLVAENLRWLEHAAWVVFEDVFLFYSCVQGRKELFEIAHKTHLSSTNLIRLNMQNIKLQEAQSQLVQSGKLAALGEMSSGVAHELNNPLHFIKGFNRRVQAAFAKGDKVSHEEVSLFITKIDENCSRMGKIIQHFREFSRQSEHVLKPTPINEIVYKSFILLNEQLRLHNIAVVKELTPDNPIILGDANRLEQVFVNLISNARDALETVDKGKQKTITVTTKVEFGTVIIEFKDNGCGIPVENLEKIFNPFFTTKDVGKGTGLGLSITHGIVTEHKGEITCKSHQGEGTVFNLKFAQYNETAIKKSA